MGVIAKGIPRGCQTLLTPVSLGYPLSIFNKNSTLKPRLLVHGEVVKSDFVDAKRNLFPQSSQHPPLS